MNLNIPMINVILIFIRNSPELIKNPRNIISQLGIDELNNVRLHVYLAIYLYEYFGQHNPNREEIVQAIESSGIISVPNTDKFIHLKQGNIFDEFLNVNATIIFRNSSRHLYIGMQENLMVKMYSTDTHSWDDVYQFSENTIQYNIVYKFINSNCNKTSYLVFIDTNYEQDSIEINSFINQKINASVTLFSEMIGKINITELAMSFTYMNDFKDDILALPIMIDAVIQLLATNNCITNIDLIDMDGSFIRYYN